MAKAANVRSLEALRDFRVALIKFIEKAKLAVSTSDSEVMHTQIWLQSQQPTHWVQVMRRCEEKLSQAQSELFRATLSQPDNPRGPTDQIRLVSKCKAEIVAAKEKLDQTKKWSRTFERSTNEYRGAISPLSSALDGNAHKAVVLIERSIETLEKYLATQTTSDTETLSSVDAQSIARKGEEQQNETEKNDEHANSNSPTNESDKDSDLPMGSSD